MVVDVKINLKAFYITAHYSDLNFPSKSTSLNLDFFILSLLPIHPSFPNHIHEAKISLITLLLSIVFVLLKIHLKLRRDWIGEKNIDIN